MEESRRERKKRETQEKIYASAMQLFRQRGLAGTSIEQITQHADVGKGTFYNYFSSKEAVVLEFSRRAYRDILAQGREKRSLGIRHRLEELLEDWAEFMIAEREMAWVAVRSREGAESDLGLHYAIQGILTLGQREGQIRADFDPVFLAETLEGMMIQHFISWFVQSRGDLKEELRRVLKVFLDGLSEEKHRA
ncbi:MAG: TetR/AcrR family transcriptional regulator [Desulfitobacteriaceae bacterium]|nr:TetR/AcrR family transcriptional regulator [Desulfitobacteriaceae bacterium]MDI6878533.1 TetR/AcrR family transcriptional regulator [Desulfitobacteriaceae bacterium]MDI6915760.1 TetR/AcrR family transcriptional regulator [Desulfitobacteriaceae bacterium]